MCSWHCHDRFPTCDFVVFVWVVCNNISSYTSFELQVHILSQALLALGKDATLLLKEHGLDDQSLDNLLVADENLLTDGVENEPEECVGSLTAPSRNSAHPACLAENLEPRLLMSAGQSPEEVGFDILGTEEFSSNGDSDSAKSPAKKVGPFWVIDVLDLR